MLNFLFDSIWDHSRKEKKTSYISLLNKNIQHKKLFSNVSASFLLLIYFYLFFRAGWAGLYYLMQYVGIKGEKQSKILKLFTNIWGNTT